MAQHSRWGRLVDLAGAVRGTDPAQVEQAVAELGAKRRWLAPLAVAAGTVAIVFDGVLLLIRNWRLTLLQLFPAAWIYAMSWNLRTHMLAHKHPPVTRVGLVAVGVLIAAQVAYWCNATFAYTLTQGARADIPAAFARARPRWRVVGGLALLTGGIQAAVWLLLPDWSLRWFWIALLVLFVVQVYLFVAVPMWLLRVAKTGTPKERLTRSLTTGVLSAVASTPGFLFNRIGLLLLGVGSLWGVGVAVLAIGAVLHVTASSSVRVVKMSVRLRQPVDGSGLAVGSRANPPPAP
jgi:hypothetical protein